MDHTTMDSLYRQLMEQGIPVVKEEPMQKHTTFRIGGPADLFCSPRSEGQLTRGSPSGERAGDSGDGGVLWIQYAGSG